MQSKKCLSLAVRCFHLSSVICSSKVVDWIASLSASHLSSTGTALVQKAVYIIFIIRTCQNMLPPPVLHTSSAHLLCSSQVPLPVATAVQAQPHRQRQAAGSTGTTTTQHLWSMDHGWSDNHHSRQSHSSWFKKATHDPCVYNILIFYIDYLILKWHICHGKD